MQAFYNGHSNQGGIYQIINKLDGKVYVGSAKGFKQRYTQHINSLNKGTHHNKHLQAAFIRDGSDAFEFHILEVVVGEQADRLLVEQKRLDSYQESWELCYNFKQQTIASSRTCFSKDPEKTKKLQSKASKELWKDPLYRDNLLKKLSASWNCEKRRKNTSKVMKDLWKDDEYRDSQVQRLQEQAQDPEWIAKMSEVNKEIGSRPEVKEKHSQSCKEMWTRPGHKEKVTASHRAFYENNPQARLEAGKRAKERWSNPEYKKRLSEKAKGRKHTDEARANISKAQKGKIARVQTYLFLSPQGEQVQFTNLREFCKDKDLSEKSMYRLCWSKTRIQHKGWKFISKL